MPKCSENEPDLANITTMLWRILQKAGEDTKTGPVIFSLGVLDERTESDFEDLISMLIRQFQKRKPQPGKVRFLLTSHPYDHIIFKFQELVDAFLIFVYQERKSPKRSKK